MSHMIFQKKKSGAQLLEALVNGTVVSRCRNLVARSTPARVLYRRCSIRGLLLSVLDFRRREIAKQSCTVNWARSFLSSALRALTTAMRYEIFLSTADMLYTDFSSSLFKTSSGIAICSVPISIFHHETQLPNTPAVPGMMCLSLTASTPFHVRRHSTWPTVSLSEEDTIVTTNCCPRKRHVKGSLRNTLGHTTSIALRKL